MSVIIVSADYIGNVIKSIRDDGHISASQLEHLLGCNGKQLHRYEAGADLIPRGVLKRIFRYAVKMEAALGTE